MRFLKALTCSPTLLVLLGLATAVMGLAAGIAPARDDTCFDLWVQRNSIYKAYGYCFKSTKAINYFGNAGCSYDNEGDIPLSHADRSTILAIKKTERSLGCL
jgi:hypothetical protein